MDGPVLFPSTRKSYLGLLYLWWLLGLAWPAASVLRNATIDDTLGDSLTGKSVTYQPPQNWDLNKSPFTLYSPDESAFAKRTWHIAALQTPNVSNTATIEFNGSAIYLYGMIFLIPGVEDTTNMSVTVDGHRSLVNYPSSDDIDIVYKMVPIYVNTSLQPGQHEVVMEMGPLSIFLFDYAAYSYEDGKSKLPIATIVGSTVGGSTLVGILLLLRGWWKLKRRHSRQGDGERLVLETPLAPPTSDPTDVDLLILSTSTSPVETGPWHDRSVVQTQVTLPSYRLLERDKPPTYCTNLTIPTAVYNYWSPTL